MTRTKEKQKLYMREWRKRNQEKQKVLEQRYRKKRNSDPIRKKSYLIYSRDWLRSHKESHRVSNCTWYAKNRESQRAYGRSWYIKNRTKRLARIRLYKKEHKESRRTYLRIWRKNNRQRTNFITNRRRTRKRNAPGACSYQQWIWRIEFYGWRCAYCKTSLNQKTVACDHRIPLSRGGGSWASNLVPCCNSCNGKKHNKTPREFYQL